jgi:shikimate dehydrogenase
MNVTGATRLFGLVGHPVRHSLSPAMHNRLFAALGIDAVYVAFDVAPDRAGAVADAIRTLDVHGCNLTVPFKGAVFGHLDRVTRAAEEALAANVIIQHHGFLTGYNTDGEGFVRSYEEELGPLPAGCRAVVLGSGGAGRAIAAALADRGAERIVLLNRSVEQAEDAAAHLRRYFPGVHLEAGPLTRTGFVHAARGAHLAVNCTAGPARAMIEAMPVPEALPRTAPWCDINYWMPAPPHVAALRAEGRPTLEGLGMLVHQGALSFELFTGLPVGTPMLRALLTDGV